MSSIGNFKISLSRESFHDQLSGTVERYKQESMAPYLSDPAERGIVKWILVAVNSNHQKNKAFAQDLLTQLEITDFDLSDRNITKVYYTMMHQLGKMPSVIIAEAKSTQGIKFLAPPTPRVSIVHVHKKTEVNDGSNLFNLSNLGERECVKWILQNRKNLTFAKDLLNKLNITNYEITKSNITNIYASIMLMFNADPSDIIAEAQSSHDIKFSVPPTPRHSQDFSSNITQRRAVYPRMNAFDFSDLNERVCVKWILQNAVKSNHQKNKDFAVDLLNKLNITNYDLSSENITAVYFAITWNLKKVPSHMLTLAQSSHGVKL